MYHGEHEENISGAALVLVSPLALPCNGLIVAVLVAVVKDGSFDVVVELSR
jgi:hypothetical protein